MIPNNDTSPAIIYINGHNVADKNVLPKKAIFIEAGDTLNKISLLSALAQAARFPEYCQPNWDSAFDCLTDSKVTDLKLDLSQIRQIDTEDFRTFKSLIEDAYADFGQPRLWVITD